MKTQAEPTRTRLYCSVHTYHQRTHRPYSRQDTRAHGSNQTPQTARSTNKLHAQPATTTCDVILGTESAADCGGVESTSSSSQSLVPVRNVFRVGERARTRCRTKVRPPPPSPVLRKPLSHRRWRHVHVDRLSCLSWLLVTHRPNEARRPRGTKARARWPHCPPPKRSPGNVGSR